jgi:GTP-binding protein Era
MDYRSGFVALVGRPNVGKSTLLNAIVGSKVAMVTEKPQTTRNGIRGILHTDRAELVLVDTPGLHRPRTRLGRTMVHTAQHAASDVDFVWHVVDLTRLPNQEDGWAADLLRRTAAPAWLVANKRDAVADYRMAVAPYRDLFPYRQVYPVSGLTGEGVDELTRAVLAELPPGPQFFPDDTVTDQAEDFYVAEVVREQVMRITRQEVPYQVAVQVEEKTRRAENLTYIRATLYVERESQRGILVGQGGRMTRQIGTAARAELERYFGHPVYLDLWVKAAADWTDRAEWLNRLGYRETRP